MAVLRSLTDAELRASAVEASVDSLPLPTGAATEATIATLALESGGNLDTIAGDTTSIDGKITACDTTGLATDAKLDDIIANQTDGSQTSIVTQSTGSNLHAVIDAGTAIIGKVGIDQTTTGTTNKVTSQLIDESGTPYGIKQVDNKPRISAMPYLYDIAEGNVPGHTPWTKIGYSPTINTSESDVWSKAGTYGNGGLFPSTAATMKLVSSNAGDTGAIIFSGTSSGGSTTTLVDAAKDFTAGTPVQVGDCIILDKSGTTPEWGYVTAVTSATTLTLANGFSSGGTGASRAYSILDYSANAGAQAVKLEYLDSTYAAKNEIVILNGASYVETIGQMLRINSFRMIASGSNNKAVGNLSLMNNAASPTITWSYITAGYTRARNAMYTVPLGKTLYIVEWNVGWSTPNDTKFQTARFFTRINIEPGTKFNTGNIFYPFTETIISNAQISVTFPIPTKIPAKSDIKVSAVAFSAGAGAGASILRGWLE
jgi:hypothetical protein